MRQIVWTIAGFDPSSGAGVTADLMTFAAHGLFGCSAITALTVQSTLGVAAAEAVRPELLRQTLEHLIADLPPFGVKIGMLGSAENATVVGEFLERLQQRTALGSESVPVPIVLDPVLRSSSGRELYPSTAMETLHAQLLPWVDWITPNWAELSLLSGRQVRTPAEAEDAARALLEQHPGLNVVVTGGDQSAPHDLLVTRDRECSWFPGEHIETAATHGTGCAFSSGLLAQVVRGSAGAEAVRGAKGYVAEALRRAPGLGRGKGPLGLLWPLEVQGSWS